ncbi:hypothetical protein C8J57DRAFT_1212732 [Mycena rebaudengoi]|nr:hypothetical protein C8J57DRAFT_1212732 [Mycena rebaudengoi]
MAMTAVGLLNRAVDLGSNSATERERHRSNRNPIVCKKPRQLLASVCVCIRTVRGHQYGCVGGVPAVPLPDTQHRFQQFPVRPGFRNGRRLHAEFLVDVAGPKSTKRAGRRIGVDEVEGRRRVRECTRCAGVCAVTSAVIFATQFVNAWLIPGHPKCEPLRLRHGVAWDFLLKTPRRSLIPWEQLWGNGHNRQRWTLGQRRELYGSRGAVKEGRGA